MYRIVRGSVLDPVGKRQQARWRVQRSGRDGVSGETEMGFTLLNGALCGSAFTLALSSPSPLLVSLHSCPCVLCSSACLLHMWPTATSTSKHTDSRPIRLALPVMLIGLFLELRKLNDRMVNPNSWGYRLVKCRLSSAFEKHVFRLPSYGLYPSLLSFAPPSTPPRVLRNINVLPKPSLAVARANQLTWLRNWWN